MAINVHIARVGVFNIDAVGTILPKDSPTITINQQMTASLEHLIIVDSGIPSSAGNPTVKAYLEAEAAADYVMEYMDQNTVITYLRNATGGYP